MVNKSILIKNGKHCGNVTEQYQKDKSNSETDLWEELGIDKIGC